MGCPIVMGQRTYVKKLGLRPTKEVNKKGVLKISVAETKRCVAGAALWRNHAREENHVAASAPPRQILLERKLSMVGDPGKQATHNF